MSDISVIKRRACVACTTAKAKCTPKAANLCQRCARLGKPCKYLDLPQTKRKHTKTAPSRVEVLERKVDQLTSQLATLTRQAGQTSPLNISNPATVTIDSSSTSDPKSNPADINTLLNAAADPSHGPDPPSRSALEGQPSIVDRGPLTEAEAERLLASFRLDFTPMFPFVVIPHGETMASLRDREPFLFLCVVVATMGSDHPLRKIVTEEIMEHVMLRIIARSERNLELLHGLLVHTAWYSYPAEKYHPRLLLLIQLCVSMMYDLGLHKKPRPSLDEQRVILGTYWISTSFYGALGRPVIMKHDSRIEECIKSVTSTEYLSDRWTTPFIHIQSFLATMDEAYASMQASSGGAFVHVTRGSLQRKLDSVKACIEKLLLNCPSSTANAIHTEIKYAEMRLEELSLREEIWVAGPNNPVRITMLMGLLQRNKELILSIRNLPVSEIAQMTVITSARICAAVGYIPTAVLTLLNLIIHSNDSDIDSQVHAIVDAADYPNLVTELANVLETRFQGLSAADRETDIVGSLCSKLRLLARCYPHQVREAVGFVSTQNPRPDSSIMVNDANWNDLDHNTVTTSSMALQIWPSVYDNPEDNHPMDELQWDTILSSLTGFT